MKMLPAIPLLDKEGARGWLTGLICPEPHHPLTPSSAEEGSYFHSSEESRSECFQDNARFLVACGSLESHGTRHSRESGNPALGLMWTPAFAGVTATMIFI